MRSPQGGRQLGFHCLPWGPLPCAWVWQYQVAVREGAVTSCGETLIPKSWVPECQSQAQSIPTAWKDRSQQSQQPNPTASTASRGVPMCAFAGWLRSIRSTDPAAISVAVAGGSGFTKQLKASGRCPLCLGNVAQVDYLLNKYKNQEEFLYTSAFHALSEGILCQRTAFPC